MKQLSEHDTLRTFYIPSLRDGTNAHKAQYIRTLTGINAVVVRDIYDEYEFIMIEPHAMIPGGTAECLYKAGLRIVAATALSGRDTAKIPIIPELKGILKAHYDKDGFNTERWPQVTWT